MKARLSPVQWLIAIGVIAFNSVFVSAQVEKNIPPDTFTEANDQLTVHAGAGALVVFHPQRQPAFAFGYRPQPNGPVDVKLYFGLLRLGTDRKLQEAVGITDDQLSQLKTTAKIPIPEEHADVVTSICEEYLAADPTADRSKIKQRLTEAVRAAGVAQEPVVAEWVKERSGILSEDQLKKLRDQMTPGRVKPTTRRGQ